MLCDKAVPNTSCAVWGALAVSGAFGLTVINKVVVNVLDSAARSCVKQPATATATINISTTLSPFTSITPFRQPGCPYSWDPGLCVLALPRVCLYRLRQKNKPGKAWFLTSGTCQPRISGAHGFASSRYREFAFIGYTTNFSKGL